MEKKILDRHKSTVTNLLHHYDGRSPFHLYLKKYFSENKKHGSKDRKLITGLCYAYFRLGGAARRLQESEAALTLSSVLDLAGYIAGLLPAQISLPDSLSKSEVVDHINTTLARFDFVAGYFKELKQQDLFPFKAVLSKELDLHSFQTSLLRQPDVFIRIRPQKAYKDTVISLLHKQQIYYRQYDDWTLALESQTQIKSLLPIHKKVVIQDISSQRTGLFMEIIAQALHQQSSSAGKQLQIWDACAASGGKSILAWDIFTCAGFQPALTVTDIRDSILKNLVTRLKESGIHGYHRQVLDLTKEHPLPFNTAFDIVICDAPCSGSGTWARNPEHLLYFEEQQIDHFQRLQKAIAQKAASAVKIGGYFLYITCSVFEKENEQVALYIEHTTQMTLVKSQLISCTKENGDSMFGALFYRSK